MNPPVKIVYNTEPFDLNYGGYDVLVHQGDGTYKCVAETREFPTVEVMQPLAADDPPVQPYDIMNNFHAAVDAADNKAAYDALWDVIHDLLDSLKLAEDNATGMETNEIWAAVEEHASKHYRED